MDDDALVTWVGDHFPGPIRAIVDRTGTGFVPEITVEQGWWPLLVRLDSQLALIDPDYRIRRVAPVAGRLCFELDVSTNRADLQRAISATIEESTRTCELCGKPGKPRRCADALYSVLCDEDAGFS